MNRSRAGLAAAAALLLAATQANGAADVEARAFLLRLLSHYPTAPSKAAFDPTGRSSPAVFDPALVALLRQASRLTAPGDIGVIEGDPLCDCQDDGGLISQIERLQMKDSTHAQAVVELLFQQSRPPERRRLTYDLVADRGAWRVFDIHTKDTPSFRNLIIQYIRDMHQRR